MPTIYLADRNAAFRKTLAHALQQRGCAVEEFDSGSELYARAVAEEPDLIVMETDLEEMDGFQVFARLQGSRPDDPFPILFVTAFEHPRVARICKDRGALGYIGKGGSAERVVGAVLGLLDEHDPLADRSLPAALAWLQSRGKSGRLRIEANGDAGYVLLHKGRVLEARWKSLRGEEALAVFSDELADARFRFIEGADEAELPEPETRRSAPEPAFSRISPEGLAPRAPPAARPVGGAVAAVRELTLAERRGRGRSAGRRSAAVAAALVLVLLTGLALAAFFPGYVPAGVASVLNNLGIPAGVREVQEAVSQLARSAEPEALAPGKAAEEANPSGPADRGVVAPGSAETLASAADAEVAGGLTTGAGAGGEAKGEEAKSREAGGGGATGVEGAKSPAPGEGAAPSKSQGGEPAAKESPGPATAGPEPRTEKVGRRIPEKPALAEARPQREKPASAAPREEAPSVRAAREGEPPPRERPVVIVRPQTGGDQSAAATPAAATDAGEPVTGPAPPGEKDAAALPPSGRPAQPTGPAGAKAEPALVQKPVLLQRGSEPYYPPELKAQGVGGTVVLRIRVGTNGRAQQVEVERSSGYEAFDQAAVATVGTFLWEPARAAAGPAEVWITQAVTFRP